MNLLTSVARIRSYQEDQKEFIVATGLFYARDDVVYLVTNRHVVLDEKKGMIPSFLRIRLHSDPEDITKSEWFDVPLYIESSARWHSHPDCQRRKIDLAVVEMDQDALADQYVVSASSESDFLPDRFTILPGEDVMVIGFPKGYSDYKHNLPLMRNAMISSVYGVDFDGKPCFLIDANLHYGMSGSPVTTRVKPAWPDVEGKYRYTGGLSSYFLGVFSANVDFSPRLEQEPEPLGLGVVWYAYLIEEIIDSIQR